MKRHAPAAERNKLPILEVLSEELPKAGTVLEIASGTGQHAAFFAQHLPGIVWQPSDASSDTLASIAEHVREAALPNLNAPILLDVHSAAWPVESVAAIVCINMIHIAPWSACLALLQGARRVLSPGSPLVLYGPYVIDGDFGAESNVAFDQRLRGENAEWGVRELRDIERAANAQDMSLANVVARPANNHVVVFRAR
ncbi:MAG TPA: DUF938 domain-containing protein [Polyangiaceae bacterium]|nr:DUF938 domain-containing protein [Polyangiaceae bacterium]